MTDVLVVTAKNKRSGAIETRRWTDPRMTFYNAVAQMGYWLTQLGWHYREIHIMNVSRQTEETTTGQVRERLMG